ncbi:RNA polymerase sigma factor [Polyangium aurulentum]|uniref:RNA polymerase sigma factor n=1 Tax=Polyangium aurulentum TaxID=2567896 RepID=UPI001F163BB2|nr:sigma-70 family RNA polymerase sigma factor [Polyangium aurulentum]
MQRALDDDLMPRAGARSLDLASVHAAHAGFVWTTLQRFGVAEPDLEDAFQDVFMVVQKKIADFDGECLVTTWLFAICRRVASTHRRRAHRRRERDIDAAPEVADASGGPEDLIAKREAELRLAKILDAMDLDRRAVFVMFEIEEMSCDAIAATVGVPVGTIYSRLHAARKEFTRMLEKEQARQARGGR